MSFPAYLKDHLAGIGIAAVAIAVAAGIMHVHGTPGTAICATCAVLAAAAAIACAVDYGRRAAFYRALRDTLDGFDRGHLVSELVERPSFAEGELFHEAFARASKDMNDEIAAYRRREAEYREYVEMWIHEVKTPIAAAHLVAANDPADAVQAMDREVERIEQYAEQALYYARSSSLERDYLIRETNLADLVASALRSNARTLIDSHVSPRLHDLDHVVYTDRKWMEFVLGQVLVNAAKYRKPPESCDEPATVTLSAERVDVGLDSACTVLTIADNGIGIPAADAGRVFDRGFTGENGRRYAKSTGMGLYLCKRLADKMRVGLSIESEAGVGTSVRISFPENRMLLA